MEREVCPGNRIDRKETVSCIVKSIQKISGMGNDIENQEDSTYLWGILSRILKLGY